ncbi:MAG TPA: hypothetical protein VEU33_23025 [Archangium sp.]|nr:hypothetical protein [Archangium sp.]
MASITITEHVMSRPLRDHPSTPEFLREFQEEHLSELAFLLAQRQRHLHSAEVEWPSIAPLEMRILRHAEAMQEGSDTASQCAREVLYVAAGEAGITDVLKRMAEADTALLPALAEALVLVPHPLLALHEELRPSTHAAEWRAWW